MKSNLYLRFLLFIFIVFLNSTSFGQVTNISPNWIIAGNGSVLTINGNNFGATRGANAYVAFEGFSLVKVLEADYVSWSNSQIKVKVPLGAGGKFYVVLSPTVSYSYDNLTVAHLPTNDSFSPTHISAGTRSVLTITGSGFGNGKTARNAVEFLNANAGQGPKIKVADEDFLSWTDNKIELIVPSGIGDGPIYMTLDNNTTKVIHPWLTIDYNVVRENNGLTKLYNQNGSGGYTFHLHSSINTNNKLKATFLQAFETWKCATGVNWRIGEPTDSRTGSNVVQILDRADVEVGAPGQTRMSYINVGGTYFVSDISIFFSHYTDHYFKVNPEDRGLYDFETTSLFVLGKAHNLGVVENADDLMYWARTVLPDVKRTPTPNALAGANYVMDISKVGTNGMPPMIPLSPGACNASYSFITSFSPTSAKVGTIVTINGTNFTGITSVKFGNALASSFTVISPTQIKAVVGVGATSGDINVVGGGGYAAVSGFVYMPRTAQTLNLPLIPSKNISDADFDLGVTVSSGLPVTYTSMSPSIVSIVNNKVHIIGAGTANILVSQAGNEEYEQISRTISFNINKLPQTITFQSQPEKVVNDPDFELDAYSSSGLPINYTSSNPAVASIINGKVKINGTGTTIITANQIGDSQYEVAASVSQVLNVKSLAQIMVFQEIGTKKVTDADFELGATVNSGLPISYSSSNTNVATIVNQKIHIVGAGTTIITASQEGNSIFAKVSKQISLQVVKLTQTISFPGLTKKYVNSKDFEAEASSDSKLQITYRSSNTNVATIENQIIRIVGAGTTTITASQFGNEIYLPAQEVTSELIVDKLTQQISFNPIGTKTFNDPDFDIIASVDSDLELIFSSSNTNVATINGKKVRIIGAGSTTITAKQSGSNIYELTSSSTILNVNKLPQVINFNPISLKAHNDFDFDPNALSNAGLPISYTSSNPSVATIVNGKIHIVAAGTSIITASQSGNSNIGAAKDVTQVLDVFFNIPGSNFSIKSTDETCKASNNGMINITALQLLNYTASVTNNGNTKTYPFSSVLAIPNLEAGAYTICINVADQPNYKQCFDVLIKEPKDLSVYSSIKDNGNCVLLKLEGGERYYIDINGKVFTTSDKEITLPLNAGNNTVKITSDKICQGQVTRNFISGNMIALYPNPVKNTLNINTASSNSNIVKVDIHALDGRLVLNGQYPITDGQTQVDVSRLNKGLYVLTLTNGNVKSVHKILKD